MPEIIPPIPSRTGWCQICGEYGASPVDVVELRRLLGLSDAPGQAHPGCMSKLREQETQ